MSTHHEWSRDETPAIVHHGDVDTRGVGLADGTYRTISDESRERIGEALADVVSPGTRRAYERQWRKFESYCLASGYQPLPADPDVVCEYLHFLETTASPERQPSRVGWSVSSINQALAAIKFVHRRALAVPKATADDTTPIPLWKNPQVDDMLQSIRHRAARQGKSAPKQKRPILLGELTTLLTEADAAADTWRLRLYARRDAAVLLLGWVGAMRREEIAALRVRDVTRSHGRWTVKVARSKTDQFGQGNIKALPTGSNLTTCGPCAVVRWMECVSTFDERGRYGLIRLLSSDKKQRWHVCERQPSWQHLDLPLFRRIMRSANIDDRPISDDVVNSIVHRRVAASSIDVDTATVGAHSLRAGFVTEAILKGTNHRAIQRQTNHKSIQALLGYAREHDAFDNNAVTDIGL